MNSIDLLRQKRESGYSSEPSEKDGSEERCFPLTEEESKGLEGATSVQCTGEVRDGKFYVESVMAPEQKQDPMMVQTTSQVSPS